VLIALGCGRDEAPPPRAAPQATAPASRGSSPNVALGTGEARDPQPFTLEQRLLDAVRRGDRPTIERALELGATVQAKDDLARSTVVLATKDAGDLELVRWLRAKGVPIDEPDLGGRTALSFAAEAGRLDLVRELVDDGALVDRPDGQQRAPLFHAVFGAHDDVVAFLLDHGAGVNARDQFGDTPLIVACAKGFASTAALLLRRGADPSLKDQEGRTAKERSAPGVEPCLGSPAR
jgi:ankyrin repeat protein